MAKSACEMTPYVLWLWVLWLRAAVCSFRDGSAGGRPELEKVAAAAHKTPVSKVVAGRRRRFSQATRYERQEIM